LGVIFFIVIFFIVVLAFLLRTLGLVDKGIESTDLMCAVESFARYYGRMPESFEELVEGGYLRPAIVNGERVYRWCLSRDDEALPPSKARQVWVSPVKIHYPLKLSFAWGVKPEDLILRNGRLYWRKQPDKEALLVRGRTWTVSERDRRWTLDIYKAMLEGAKRRASQSAPARQRARSGRRSTGTSGKPSIGTSKPSTQRAR